ncbi:Anthranilate synthase [Candidatus Vidania fulgoroideae]|nr:Anthranilate synthase [Candidatus Vidania fulgoroideae]
MIKLFNYNKNFFAFFTNNKSINYKNIFVRMCIIFKKNLYNKYYTKIKINHCKKEIFNFCKFTKKGRKNIFIASEYKFSNKKIKIYQDFFFFAKKKSIFFFCEKKKETVKILKQILKNKKNKKPFFFYLKKKNNKRKRYIDKYKNIIKLIKNGTIMQIQLSKENLIKTNIKSYCLFNILKSENKNQIYLENLRCSLICFSPEILSIVYRKHRRIHLFPIAGTIGRGKDIIEDKFLEKKLLNNRKEISEHSMLIDLSRNDLNIFSLENTVKVNEAFKIKKFKNVQHIVSNVMSRFSKRKNINFILKSISPSGTLSGSPKNESIKIIEKHDFEKSKRNIYKNVFFGGSIGFLKMKKYLAYLMIIIRTSFLKKGYILLKASSGITLKSRIIEEYLELNKKMLFFLKKNDTNNR